jgi:hypothetical protein
VHGQYAEGHHRAKTPHDHLSESRHGFDEKSDCNLGRKLNQLLVVSYAEYYKILIISTQHNYSMLYILSYIQLYSTWIVMHICGETWEGRTKGRLCYEQENDTRMSDGMQLWSKVLIHWL